jgi:hypothetical protein
MWHEIGSAVHPNGDELRFFAKDSIANGGDVFEKLIRFLAATSSPKFFLDDVTLVPYDVADVPYSLNLGDGGDVSDLAKSDVVLKAVATTLAESSLARVRGRLVVDGVDEPASFEVLFLARDGKTLGATGDPAFSLSSPNLGIEAQKELFDAV